MELLMRKDLSRPRVLDTARGFDSCFPLGMLSHGPVSTITLTYAGAHHDALIRAVCMPVSAPGSDRNNAMAMPLLSQS